MLTKLSEGMSGLSIARVMQFKAMKRSTVKSNFFVFVSFVHSSLNLNKKCLVISNNFKSQSESNAQETVYQNNV